MAARKNVSGVTSKTSFDKELRDIFDLIKAITAGSNKYEHATEIHAEEFQKLQELLASISSPPVVAGAGTTAAKSSKSSRASVGSAPNAANSMGTINYLRLLKQSDFAKADSQGSGSLDFPSFAAWQREFLQAAVRGFSERKQLILDGISELEKLQLRCSVVAALEKATGASLEQSCKEAEVALGKTDPALAPHRERLALFKVPFNVTLSTLGGEQHELEVDRCQSVSQLRSKAAKLFEKKTLSTFISNRKQSP